jgi:hypothetical protein
MASKLELPDLPALEAAPQEHLDFANLALKRRWNLIARVRKFGNASPLLVLVFENQDELALTAQQHGYGGGLIDQLASYDGQLCPTYSKPQLRVIYAALIRAADLWEADSWHDELMLDLNAFIDRCLAHDEKPPLRRPENGEHDTGALFRAVSDFQTVNKGRTGRLDAPPPVLLFWRNATLDADGYEYEMWIPRAALLAHLRGVRNWTSGSQLRNALLWFGWQQRHLQARAKGDWRQRAHVRVWAVPVPWEPCETDLLALAVKEFPF